MSDVSSFKFGPTIIARVRDAADLRKVLSDSWFDSPTIIVKPNWVSTERADFTDVQTMRTLFEALEANFVVVESHMLLRHSGGKTFMAGDKMVDWNWLLVGEGWNWLIDHPDWAWFKAEGHWEQIQKEEQRFLDENGFSELFEAFNVTYINVTEEVWNGRICDPTVVRETVEARFKPLQTEAFLSMVPSKLFDLRGSTFISLAKLKHYASFTFKNMFGMIPDPLRPYWHGSDGSRAAQSIVDINKIYHALFNVYGICEAIHRRAVAHPQGEFKGVYMGKYNVIEEAGLVACGRDIISLDHLLLALTEGLAEEYAPVNRAPLELAAKEFGSADQDAILTAARMVGDWFALPSSQAVVQASQP